MSALTPEQVEAYRRDGYLLAPDAVTQEQLAALRAQLDAWVEESRGESGPYGAAEGGRSRFDLAPDHNPAKPALRRVNNPAEISAAFAEVAFDSPMVDMIAELIGPDVKFHHGKVNAKLPATTTKVDYHQDFSYTPHSNDDIVTALLLLEDMTLENGCLMVVPGSQREGQKSLWQEGVFTGKVDSETEREARRRAVPVTGPAGAVCFMHTQLLHGSEANASGQARNLFINVYTAADAWPLAPSPLPNRDEGRIVRGAPSRRLRLKEMTVELPAAFQGASFFTVQETAGSGQVRETGS